MNAVHVFHTYGLMIMPYTVLPYPFEHSINLRCIRHINFCSWHMRCIRIDMFVKCTVVLWINCSLHFSCFFFSWARDASNIFSIVFLCVISVASGFLLDIALAFRFATRKKKIPWNFSCKEYSEHNIQMQYYEFSLCRASEHFSIRAFEFLIQKWYHHQRMTGGWTHILWHKNESVEHISSS